MANFKRKKSKRQVKCTICTTHRWKGNSKDRFKKADKSAEKLYSNILKNLEN
jgi:hypothetical protein